MDLNTLFTTFATAWSQITAIFVELVNKIDWNSILDVISEFFSSLA